MESTHNSSRYEITKEGDDTLLLLRKQYLPAIIEDIDSYLKENKFRLRNEVGVISDFYKSTNQDYIVHCEVREGKSILIGFRSLRPRQRPGRDDGQPLEGAEPGDLLLCDENADEGMIFKSGISTDHVLWQCRFCLHSLIPVPSLRFPLPSQPFSQPIPRLSPPGSPPRRSEDLLRQPSCR